MVRAISFVLLFIVGISLCIALYIFMVPQRYLAFVIAAEPAMTLVILKPKGQKIVTFSLPGDTYIEGVGGYGKYSLSALWKLGTIDKRGGALVSESLSETLGAPITRYISGERGIDLFRWRNVGTFLTGQYTTNMTLSEFIGVVKRLSDSRPGEIEEIDLAKTTLFEKKILPDGTGILEVDLGRIDPIVRGAFENEEIRGEAKRIAVVNTTEIPGLGSGVAKTLSHIGTVVVSVSNSTEAIDRCVIEVSEEARKTKTVAFIHSYYHCEIKIEALSDRADIRVLVGKGYAARFEKLK